MKEPQYITDADGTRTAVVLDLTTYQELLKQREKTQGATGYTKGQTQLVGTSGTELVALLNTLQFDPAGLDEMERIIEEDCERIDLNEW